jgi:hypothetical protein
MLLNKITLKFALVWRCYSVIFSEMDTYLIGVWLCENQRTIINLFNREWIISSIFINNFTLK